MTIHTDYRVSPYMLIILLSFALSYLLIFLYSKGKSINRKHLVYSMFLHFLISMYCGYAFNCVINMLKGNPPFSKVGLSSMGGMVGTIISIVAMSFIFKEQKEHYIKCYVMSLPLIYGISKMACFFSGCCYGMAYDRPLCVKYISNGVMTPDHCVFPVQLLESITFVILALIFYHLVSHKNINNLVWYEIISCCFLKFILDYLRNRNSMSLSVNQKACILISGLILIFLSVMAATGAKKALQ